MKTTIRPKQNSKNCLQDFLNPTPVFLKKSKDNRADLTNDNWK
jgi:hypothetical protein